MGLETGTFISDLNTANPTSGDPKSQGDDHIRLVKSTIKATFPNVTGAVTVTHTDINGVSTKATKTGDTYTGTHNFTGGVITVPTAATNDSTTNAASTAYVQAALTNAALSGTVPGQAGNAGKFLTTNGTALSWGDAATLTGTQTLTNKTLGSGTDFTGDALARLHAIALYF